jgi:hypothetical protein
MFLEEARVAGTGGWQCSQQYPPTIFTSASSSASRPWLLCLPAAGRFSHAYWTVTLHSLSSISPQGSLWHVPPLPSFLPSSLHLFLFFLSLNSGPCACWAGALPLEPCPQPFSDLVFFHISSCVFFPPVQPQATILYLCLLVAGIVEKLTMLNLFVEMGVC